MLLVSYFVLFGGFPLLVNGGELATYHVPSAGFPGGIFTDADPIVWNLQVFVIVALFLYISLHLYFLALDLLGVHVRSSWSLGRVGRTMSTERFAMYPFGIAVILFFTVVLQRVVQ